MTPTESPIPDRSDAKTVATPRFRSFSNPTGEQFEFMAVAQDSDDDVVRFKWRSLPGGSITEHVHPHQEERFTIIAGEAHFTVNGEERVVRAGETIVVPRRGPPRRGKSRIGRDRWRG